MSTEITSFSIEYIESDVPNFPDILPTDDNKDDMIVNLNIIINDKNKFCFDDFTDVDFIKFYKKLQEFISNPDKISIYNTCELNIIISKDDLEFHFNMDTALINLFFKYNKIVEDEIERFLKHYEDVFEKKKSKPSILEENYFSHDLLKSLENDDNFMHNCKEIFNNKNQTKESNSFYDIVNNENFIKLGSEIAKENSHKNPEIKDMLLNCIKELYSVKDIDAILDTIKICTENSLNSLKKSDFIHVNKTEYVEQKTPDDLPEIKMVSEHIDEGNE